MCNTNILFLHEKWKNKEKEISRVGTIIEGELWRIFGDED